jgi:proline iminopeptidase
MGMRGAAPLLIALCLALPATAAKPPGHLMRTTGGTTLWYEVRGGAGATPLMVLNGGPGAAHDYMLVSTVWDSLARRRPVVFYDQRGVGRSPALTKAQTCTLADQIDDLEALRAQLGYARMDVLGHSWGGMLAMAYAARHPERIAHLILCDSGAPRFEDTKFLFADVFPEVNEHIQGNAFAEQLRDTSAEHVNFHLYQSMLAVDTTRRAALRELALPPFVVAVNEAILADYRRFDLGPELPKFRFPALVITGRFDANVAPSVAWKIHQAIPGSEFAVFERSGHLPFYEEPEAFVARVERFLAGRP